MSMVTPKKKKKKKKKLNKKTPKVLISLVLNLLFFLQIKKFFTSKKTSH